MSTQSEAKQPNILVFITDQQRADYLGCAGHPVLKTPNIDAIATGGTRFERFYVANPVCMPNRAAIMTGRHTSVNGVRMNGCPLPLDANTFVRKLQADGYHTALLGKSHLQTFSGMRPPAFDLAAHGPDQSGESWFRYASGDYGQESFAAFKAGADPTIRPYYGYNTTALVTWHGDANSGHYLNWLRERLPDHETYLGKDNELEHSYTCPQAVRTALPEELYSTSYIAEQAEAWITERKDDDAPFFAFVSFDDPHHPFNPPGKYWDMYDPEDFEVPENFHNSDDHALGWLKSEDTKLKKDGPFVFPVTEQQAKEAMALTCGMITMIDDAVGRVMAALHASGQADNTIVVFTSDHGDMLGDQGLLLKGGPHYQSIIRVPFLINDPRNDAQPETSNALACSMDIGQTFLEAAGIDPYHGMQGQSFMPVLEDGPYERENLLIEDVGAIPFLGFARPPVINTLQTDRYRFSVYEGEDFGELFDLQEDPTEQNNLFDAPSARDVKSDLTMQLLQARMAACDPSPRPYELA